MSLFLFVGSINPSIFLLILSTCVVLRNRNYYIPCMFRLSFSNTQYLFVSFVLTEVRMVILPQRVCGFIEEEHWNHWDCEQFPNVM